MSQHSALCSPRRIALALCVSLFPLVASAQPVRDASPGIRRTILPRSADKFEKLKPILPVVTQDTVRRTIPLWLSPALSAILPGAGQIHLGQERFAGYLAVEAFGWIRYLHHRADGKRSRNGYRTLAADVARSVFTPNAPVGQFEYYERMREFLESGVFDVSDDPDIQPEVDESTFNGFLWRRARETFWDDPNEEPPVNSAAYLRSIAFYSEQAITADFRWSWRNAQLEHDLFRRTIDGSNDAFRSAVTDLGVILGNHLLSMVDAFVTLRLRGAVRNGESAYSVTGSIPLQIRRR